MNGHTQILAVLQLDAFINLWLCKTRIEIEQLCKDNEILKNDMLNSQLSTPLLAWNNIKFLLQKDAIFINHIQNHLKPTEQVICKICGRTANEILNNERKKGTGKLTINDVPPPQEANFI